VAKYEVYKTVTYDYSQWVEAETPTQALYLAQDSSWTDVEPTDEFFTVFGKEGDVELRLPEVSPT
jgi:hypothetical protein